MFDVVLRRHACFGVVLALAAGEERPDLQRAVAAAMGGRAGAAVVLDVESGRLLAAYHIDVAARRLVRPGSVVKPFTLLALLEAGKVVASSKLVCRRQLWLGGRRMDCTHPETPLPLDAESALAYSCNFFFATFGAELSGAEWAQAVKRAGLVSLTGLAAQEAAGTVTAAASPEGRQLEALGEAGILVTPLGLAAAYRKLALERQRAAAAPALLTVFAGLEAAADYGTARLAQPTGLRVAGKTGTATEGSRQAAHAWFAGYAPADNPRIAVVVFLEQGTGGREAAPIAAEIFRRALL